MHVKRHGIIQGSIQKVSRNSPAHVGYSLIRQSGWGKKLAYCVAFSTDGATDVTRRYVRNPAEHGLDRTRCPEQVLLYITLEIRKIRRANMEKEAQRRLIDEDAREEKELRSYVAQAVTADMVSSFPGAVAANGEPPRASSGDGIKTPAARQSGSPEWINARGENGMGQNGPNYRHDGR